MNTLVSALSPAAISLASARARCCMSTCEARGVLRTQLGLGRGAGARLAAQQLVQVAEQRHLHLVGLVVVLDAALPVAQLDRELLLLPDLGVVQLFDRAHDLAVGHRALELAGALVVRALQLDAVDRRERLVVAAAREEGGWTMRGAA